MLAGGDSVDDVAVLRADAAGALFDGIRAPSTVGAWLRAHKRANVRHLDVIGSFLTKTVSRVRNAGAFGQLTVRADSAFYSEACSRPG